MLKNGSTCDRLVFMIYYGQIFLYKSAKYFCTVHQSFNEYHFYDFLQEFKRKQRIMWV